MGRAWCLRRLDQVPLRGFDIAIPKGKTSQNRMASVDKIAEGFFSVMSGDLEQLSGILACLLRGVSFQCHPRQVL